MPTTSTTTIVLAAENRRLLYTFVGLPSLAADLFMRKEKRAWFEACK